MITLVETPEDMAQLMRDCIHVTYEWIDKANKHWHLNMPYYKVVFALKSGTAGKARLGEGVIQFNPTLLRENPVAFLARTPGHEVIHFANHKVHGPDVGAHGPEWKRMMIDMNLPLVVTHTIPRVCPPRYSSVRVVVECIRLIRELYGHSQVEK